MVLAVVSSLLKEYTAQIQYFKGSLARTLQPGSNSLEFKSLHQRNCSSEGLIEDVWYTFKSELSGVHKLSAGLTPLGDGAVVVEILDFLLGLVGSLPHKIL